MVEWAWSHLKVLLAFKDFFLHALRASSGMVGTAWHWLSRPLTGQTYEIKTVT